MARSYLPSLFGRGEETLGSLFRDVEKVFEEFSRRPPFAFGVEASGLPGPKIDIAGTKDAIDVQRNYPASRKKILSSPWPNCWAMSDLSAGICGRVASLI